MSRRHIFLTAASLAFFTLAFGRGERSRADEPKAPPAAPRKASGVEPAISHYSAKMLRDGQHTFRYDTFGDEAFWGGALKLHQAIAGEKHGGTGPGVSPKTALSVGLKVDADALPPALVEQLKAGKVNLDDPATTFALLELNSVVGLTGFFDQKKKLTAVGIQCSLCHSTVDDSLAPGIGRRRDGWANRDLNVGEIIALAPDLSVVTTLIGVDDATLRKVLNGWGPGEALFAGAAKCATCHVPPIFTEPGWNMHTAAEMGVDAFQADRSPDKAYRTAPLKGLFAHAKGGFFRDGRFATLLDVVNHYDGLLGLKLGEKQKTDLVEYLKSL